MEENNIELDELGEGNIQKYIVYLQSQFNLNDKSINTHLRGVRAFSYYCQKLNYCDKFKVELIRTQDKAKETYRRNEIEILLKKPDTEHCSFADFRNWTIVNFLMATGVRLSTLVNLEVKHLDFENMLVNLSHTKNRKAQLIPMIILPPFSCYITSYSVWCVPGPGSRTS